MNFELLVNTIQDTHNNLQQSAVKAVNVHLTLRNWLVGFYIVEYEQKGEDRAKYGSQLLNNLANSIKIKGLTSPELSRCRQFYQTYSSILGVITQELHSNLPVTIQAITTLSTKPFIYFYSQELQYSVMYTVFAWKAFRTKTAIQKRTALQ
jgi:hypothetical protein